MMPTVANIRLYPIKSLDPIEVNVATIGARSLLHDRAYAFISEDGAMINGKRTGRVNELRAIYDLMQGTVQLGQRDDWHPQTFHLAEDKAKLEAYVSSFFNLPVYLVHNTEGRLMDIPDVSGITIVSQATLQYLADALLGETVETMRLRFRANLEVGGVPPFWEDQLHSEASSGTPFSVGAVNLIGISLRARCNVPPRDPYTGVLDKGFVKKMITARDRNVPPWSQVRTLGSLYHLTINTFVPDSELGKAIRVQDVVQLGEPLDSSLPQLD